MNGTMHREIDAYLRRLDRSLRDLPAERRDEIVAEIRDHIAEMLSAHPAATDAEVRNALERVGDAASIAAEARDRFGVEPAKRRWTDLAAIVLLLVGGFAIVGWFVGVVLLWISDAWSTRDKLIGTLIVPGGLAPALFIGVFAVGGGTCTASGSGAGTIGSCDVGGAPLAGPLGAILWLALLIAPILTAIYLGRRLRSAR